VECAYVESDVVPGCDFFASKVEIGPEGVMKIHPVGDITPYEQELLDAAIPDIQANIKKGVDFANEA
jgi:malate dehydrogenase